jgi:hypothetical protein
LDTPGRNPKQIFDKRLVKQWQNDFKLKTISQQQQLDNGQFVRFHWYEKSLEKELEMENVSCQFTEWRYLANDLYSYTIAVIIFASISIIPTAVLNSAILIAIVRTRPLHTPQNIFMCNLAISNIGVSCLGVPLSITWKVTELYHHDNDLVCFFAFFAYIICSLFCGVSFLTVTAASVDRFLALRLHLTYVTMVTNMKTIIACMVLWVMSLTLALLLVVGQYVYSIATATAILFIMMVMAYCYLNIFHILRHHHNQIQSQITSQPNSSLPNISRYRKSVISLIYVLGIYIGFYSPYLSSLVVIAFQGASIFSLKLWNVGVLLLFVNSFVNPLFHCLKFEEIRVAIKGTASHFLTQITQTVNS